MASASRAGFTRRRTAHRWSATPLSLEHRKRPSLSATDIAECHIYQALVLWRMRVSPFPKG